MIFSIQQPTTDAGTASGHSEAQLQDGVLTKVVLATKFGYIIGEVKRIVSRNDIDVTRQIRQECEGSLRRLNAD